MRKIFLFAMIAMSAILVSCNKPAQENKPKDEHGQQASPEMSALRTALDLARYGYEAESASALIEAANILASTPTQAMQAVSESSLENANVEQKDEKVKFTPDALLKDAREWAEDDANLMALADRVQAKIDANVEGTRGAVGGPQFASGTVYPNSYVCYNVKFWGDDWGEVAVIGDGDTDLDLYVYDDCGNLIDLDADFTDDCYVGFYVLRTSYFRIKIVNNGRLYNNFVLYTN